VELEQTYDRAASYQENYGRGPQFGAERRAVPQVPWKEFLGCPVRSRVGIAAGLLLNSEWILGYAERGFDLLTYKTVRSSFRPCYELPNWVFVEESPDEAGTYFVTDDLPDDPREVSSSVCFGMPSMAPEVWRKDVARAKGGLAEGQLLIVSVVATPLEDWTLEMAAADFVQCAVWARDAGADVVEANFSCPNVCSSEGSIYLDAESSGYIASEIRKAIGQTPLLIKTGHYADEGRLGAYLHALDGLADGVTLVNCLIGKVIHRDGSPIFGEAFVEAGVLGRTIHDPCVKSVRKTADMIERDGLRLQVAAVGGAATADDVARYFDAGADAVMMGSAPMYLPDLAAELKGTRPDF